MLIKCIMYKIYNKLQNNYFLEIFNNILEKFNNLY